MLLSHYEGIEKMVLPAGVAPASFRLEGGCLRLLGHGSVEKMVAHPGASPGVSPFQAGRIDVFLMRGILRVVTNFVSFIKKWRLVRALLPRPSVRQTAALHS